MKKYISFLLILTMGLFYSGCDDALDINEDPLAATSANPDLIFPEVLVNFSNNRTIEISGRMSNVVQYYEPAFGVFGDMALGELGNTFLTGNTWSNYYTNGLKNLFLIENDAAAQTPPNNNVIAQCKIMQAMIFYSLTGMWENVPFTDVPAAVRGEVDLPTYDNQETILRGIVDLLDEAVGLMNNNLRQLLMSF